MTASSLAIVIATAACSSGPDETTGESADGVTAAKEGDGPSTETAPVPPRSTTDGLGEDQSVLEPVDEGAAPGEQFVAAGQSCPDGRSLRPYRANACRVGVSSAGTGDTITAHQLRWSILGWIYKCTVRRVCAFNTADGPGCGEGGEPTPPNTYCNKTFPNSETEQMYWGEGTLPSGYTAVKWCQEKYAERAADIQARAVKECNREATKLANTTRRDLACCVPTSSLTTATSAATPL